MLEHANSEYANWSTTAGHEHVAARKEGAAKAIALWLLEPAHLRTSPTLTCEIAKNAPPSRELRPIRGQSARHVKMQ